MRELLCREKEKTQYVQGDTAIVRPCNKITSLSCDELHGKNDDETCHVAANEVVKSNSDEHSSILRQHRRKSLDFEQEFTFTPKLNLTSVRMAKGRTGKAHLCIERRTRNSLVGEVQMNFTFKPKVSSRSEKIAQSLKTSFLERQLIHVERQKKMLDSQDISSVYFSQKKHSKLVPVVRKQKTAITTSSEIQNSSQNTREGKADDYESVKVPANCSTTNEPRHEHVVEPIESHANAQKLSEKMHFKSPYACQQGIPIPARKHNRLRTHPGVSREKDILILEDTPKTVKFKEKHRKVATVPTKCSPMFRKLEDIKHTADKAIREHKVYVCHGPYPVVRACLRRRGWVEKYFKSCQTEVTKDKKKTASTDDEENHIENAEHGGSEDIDGYESTEENVWCTGSDDADGEYSLLSRLCRNATASFYWSCKRDDIDFKYLRKDQIANHFSKAYSFTTKVGLCTHLRNLSWFEGASSDEFFPRCHRLGANDEKEAFIDDYRLTSACNILKLLIKRSSNEVTTREKTPSAVKSKSMRSLSSGVHSRTQARQASPTGSTRSRSSLNYGERYSSNGVVSSSAVVLAWRACRQFIMCRNNEDIDSKYEHAMLTEDDWNSLVGFYNQLIHPDSRIEGGEEFLEKSKKVLEEMRKLLPQLDLDGVRNVWIVKPGAKSRGRGIICMDRLDEILKLVSSTVAKENRWIVQKYIESPLLIYNTKFDIRQWFLVTDWNPLTLWFYKDCYFRFCSQEFTLENFEPCIHLANNSIQKHYQNGIRDERLPENNMWSSEEFKDYLKERNQSALWENLIYPGMRQAIVYALECCQSTVEARKNSFELYGADFMLTEDYKPWLIEINSSPAMGASTAVTKKLCANVIEDTMKVVLDRREDKNCDTGRFELAFKQPYVDAPPYIGINLAVNGKSLLGANSPYRRQTSANRLEKMARPKGKNLTTNAKHDDDSLTVNTEVSTVSNEDSPKEGTAEGKEKEARLAKTTMIKTKETQSRGNDELKSEILNPRQNNAKGNSSNLRSNQIEKFWKSQHNLDAEKKMKLELKKSVLTFTMDKEFDTSVFTNTKGENVDKQREKGHKVKNHVNNVKNHVDNPESHVNNVENLTTPNDVSNLKPCDRHVDKNRTPKNKNKSSKSVNQKKNIRHPSTTIITMPEIGNSKTILRYTDKRYRRTKTVVIDTRSELKLRKKSPDVVIN